MKVLGIHHVAAAEGPSPGLAGLLALLGGAGTRIAFIHPSAAGGVLVELVEDPLFPSPAAPPI